MIKAEKTQPAPMRIDDGSSIFYRVETLTSCEAVGGTLHAHSTVAGKRPVMTDSHGTLFGRMEEVGGESLLGLRFDWVAPYILRVRCHQT